MTVEGGHTYGRHVELVSYPPKICLSRAADINSRDARMYKYKADGDLTVSPYNLSTHAEIIASYFPSYDDTTTFLPLLGWRARERTLVECERARVKCRCHERFFPLRFFPSYCRNEMTIIILTRGRRRGTGEREREQAMNECMNE